MSSNKFKIVENILIIKSQDINIVFSQVINIELKKNITTLKFQELGRIQQEFLEILFEIINLKKNIIKLDFSNKINSRDPNEFNKETLTFLLSKLNQTNIIELDLSNIKIIDLENINIFNLIDKSGIYLITIKLCDIEGLKLNQENYKIIQRLKKKNINIWLNHTSEQIHKIIQSIQTISV